MQEAGVSRITETVCMSCCRHVQRLAEYSRMRRRDAVSTEESANCSTMRIGRRRFGIAKAMLWHSVVPPERWSPSRRCRPSI